MAIQIGCINRPWTQCELGEALAGIAAAGFRTCALMLQQGKFTVTADTTPDELEAVRAELDRAGLELQMVLSPMDLAAPTDQVVARFGKAMANAVSLGARYMLTGGTMDEALYEKFYEVARAVCDAAVAHDLEIVLKPHGGCSATADELLVAAEEIDRPNFSICYDPGNIYYYTGQRAEDDLPRVVDYVSCMCVKDERGGKQGEVMITPGTGVVDFVSIFRTLADARFDGPCWVECLGGETLDQINAEAVKAKQFLDGVLAQI